MDIQEHQDNTGIIPWIKRFEIHKKYYVVLGKENVELIEEIIKYKNHMINQHDEFINSINLSSNNDALNNSIMNLYKQILEVYDLMLYKLRNEDYSRDLHFREKYEFLLE